MENLQWLFDLQKEVKNSLTENWRFVNQDVFKGNVYEKYINVKSGEIMIINYIKNSNVWGCYILDLTKTVKREDKF